MADTLLSWFSSWSDTLDQFEKLLNLIPLSKLPVDTDELEPMV